MNLQTEVEHYLQTAREDLSYAEDRLVKSVHEATPILSLIRLHWGIFAGIFVAGAVLGLIIGGAL